MSNHNVKSQKHETSIKWDCKCGKKKIKSNFCPACGAKRPHSSQDVPAENNLKSNKKLWIIIGIVALLVVAAIVTGVMLLGNKDDSKPETKLLSFAQATSLSTMKEMDGQQVTIIGYMSTLSPVNGQFMYLMNLPYQSCPFCIPNTTQLSNTIAVYAEEGQEFKFTDRAIQVVGTLEFGSWTDEFGYTYDYRINNANFTVVDTENMSEELKLWQEIAASNIIADVNALYEYVNFICYWSQYVVQFGDTYDYLYANDAKQYIVKDGYYFQYTQPAYYDALIKKIEAIDKEKLADLVTMVKDLQDLSARAIKDLEDGKYTVVPEYGSYFGDKRNQYKLDNYEQYDKEFMELWNEFAVWMAQWEV